MTVTHAPPPLRPPPRRPPVGSMYTNVAALVAEQAPGSGRARLGARWSFALPHPAFASEIVEYSLPRHPRPYVDLLAERTGVHVDLHGAEDARGLHRHLQAGGTAIVAIDSFHLPYRPAFRRVHSHRTVIVRGAVDRGSVWVDDRWPPVFGGFIPTDVLDRARYSLAPLDPATEPIFAGRPVTGEWFTVAADPFPEGDRAEWVASLLGTLWWEAASSGTGSWGCYGIDGLCRLADRLAGVTSGHRDRDVGIAERRLASLLLRTELGARVQLQALLVAAAAWTRDGRIATAAERYLRGLEAMSQARDVLTKSLRSRQGGHQCYLRYIAGQLRTAAAAEQRLLSALSPYAQATGERQPLKERSP